MNINPISIPDQNEIMNIRLRYAKEYLKFTEQDYQALSENLTRELSQLTICDFAFAEFSLTKLYLQVKEPQSFIYLPATVEEQSKFYAAQYRTHTHMVRELATLVLDSLYQKGYIAKGIVPNPDSPDLMVRVSLPTINLNFRSKHPIYTPRADSMNRRNR